MSCQQIVTVITAIVSYVLCIFVCSSCRGNVKHHDLA